MWSDYLFAASVGEALRLLSEHGGEARLIAGGTDLLTQYGRGKRPARVLVDVTRIPGWTVSRRMGTGLRWGPTSRTPRRRPACCCSAAVGCWPMPAASLLGRRSGMWAP